jgi:hypothetical protein
MEAIWSKKGLSAEEMAAEWTKFLAMTDDQRI